MASFVDLFQRRFGPITTTKFETDILFDTWHLLPDCLIANWGDYDILLNWNRLHLKMICISKTNSDLLKFRGWFELSWKRKQYIYDMKIPLPHWAEPESRKETRCLSCFLLESCLRARRSVSTSWCRPSRRLRPPIPWKQNSKLRRVAWTEFGGSVSLCNDFLIFVFEMFDLEL